MSKKEMITKGEDISLDEGNVIVLNGVSVAEKVQEENKEELASDKTELDQNVASEKVDTQNTTQLAEETPAKDEMKIPEENHEIPVVPIDLSSIASPEPQVEIPSLNSSYNNDFMVPDKSFDAPDYPLNSDGFKNDYNPTFDQENNGLIGNFDSFNKENNNSTSMSDINKSVFKTEVDVDNAFKDFINDVKTSYDKRISAPTRVLVDFVNDFANWGKKVTEEGLNRQLFDEYDELIAKLNKIENYRVDSNDYNEEKSLINFGSEANNYNTLPSFGDNDTNENNYGGMVA